MAKPDCPQCEGTGWRPVEPPAADGVRRVERCSCNEAERSDELLRRGRIPRRYEHCTFENFHIRKDRESGQTNQSLRTAKLWAERFVEEYPTDFGLLFVGTTGVGKTHLAVAVLRELMIQKGVPCLFYDFRDLLQEIRESYNPVSQTSEFSVVAPVLDAEVLLLDEVIAANPSDWVKETLAHIINSRYNQKKATLITTTLPLGETSRRADTGARPSPGGGPNEARAGTRMPSGESVPSLDRSLDQFGVTLSSRLYEMCKLVEMKSDDFRKAIKQAGYRFHAE
ncbi:MAG TPA: ATP-binding protein [Terriglobia bacterium]|nr:ATP-binding protein [Terriglobia bacterium]